MVQKLWGIEIKRTKLREKNQNSRQAPSLKMTFLHFTSSNTLNMIPISQKSLSFAEWPSVLKIGSNGKSHLPQTLVLKKEPRKFQTALSLQVQRVRKTWARNRIALEILYKLASWSTFWIVMVQKLGGFEIKRTKIREKNQNSRQAPSLKMTVFHFML